MLRFRILLWLFAKLIARAMRNDPDVRGHAAGKDVAFQIRTFAGAGRHYRIADSHLTSAPGTAADADFTLAFRDGATGFRVLSAQDAKDAFLQALHDDDLRIDGDFVKVMWFQRLTDLLKAKG